MKTTIAGILTIIGAVSGAVVHFLTTGNLSTEVLTATLAGIATGFGLIKAADSPKP